MGAITARVFAAVTKLNFRECWRGDKGHHSGSGRAGVPGRFRRKPVLPVASCRLTGFLKGTVQVHAPRCRSQVMSLEDLRMGFEELPSELGVPRGQRPLLRRHGPGKLCLSHRRRPEGWPTPTLPPTHPSRPNNHQLQAQYRPQYTQHNITVQYSAGCTHTTPNPRPLGLGPKSKIHSGGGGGNHRPRLRRCNKTQFSGMLARRQGPSQWVRPRRRARAFP